MKKIFMTLLVALATVCAVSAQTQKMTVEQLYAKYDGGENVVTMNIPGEMLVTSEANPDIATNVSNLMMIISESAPKEFRDDVDRLLDSGDYTSLMNINAEGDRVAMYMSKDKGEFLLVVYSSDGEMVFMCTKGESLNVRDMMVLAEGVGDMF
ncbi:MAG: DUF4252 domain-containing protein [Rikenellaceae bacterium]|nr:DUF4252 domain-containing protein [Rikenellaceae bacterium]